MASELNGNHEIDKVETNKQMKGEKLGEFEEIVLLCICILYDDAYGLAIAREIEKRTKRNVTLSSVHKTLMRMEQKGYVTSGMGGANDSRGGRRKRLFSITNSGKEVIREAHEQRQQMWRAIPQVVWDLKLSLE